MPASGKSTFAKNYVKENKNTINIEKDIIRQELFRDKHKEHVLIRDSEILVLHIQFQRILESLKQGKNVVLSNTHLDDRHIDVFKEIADIFNAEFIIKDFRGVPLETCIKRDKNRKVQSVYSIENLHKKYIK